ncbi:hypothetical protein BDB00DRAFT_879533 [Zychaea mexicana]|uniref:uncharacterized protein n=1 Tax=Zychaea mexicana TaxID=64656 RepID=UPI0022FDB97F|nr:uncharacterized protein BDB00DRAFT_879533 [Zychaea mexicana]KAI9477057.1 hypothetical protein BDB00DRAFT_879533 [Zychaea mexicana]
MEPQNQQQIQSQETPEQLQPKLIVIANLIALCYFLLAIDKITTCVENAINAKVTLQTISKVTASTHMLLTDTITTKHIEQNHEESSAILSFFDARKISMCRIKLTFIYDCIGVCQLSCAMAASAAWSIVNDPRIRIVHNNRQSNAQRLPNTTIVVACLCDAANAIDLDAQQLHRNIICQL